MVEIDGFPSSISNFLSFLPTALEKYILIYEQQLHRKIVAALTATLSVSHVIDLESITPDQIRGVERHAHSQSTTGMIAFVTFDRIASNIKERKALLDALDCFNGWPPERIVLCEDVIDTVFCSLFSENSALLKKKCDGIYAQVHHLQSLCYQPFDKNDKSYLLCSVGDSEWVTYSGQENYEYMLPSGEIACYPSDISGKVQFNGWIIGTIPFGKKYGLVSGSDLAISFERGSITRIDGDHLALCAELEAILTLCPHLRKASELGLGVSEGVVKAARQSKAAFGWIERAVGLHIGLGAELPEMIIHSDNRLTQHHLDLVFSSGRVTTVAGMEILDWKHC